MAFWWWVTRSKDIRYNMTDLLGKMKHHVLSLERFTASDLTIVDQPVIIDVATGQLPQFSDPYVVV